MIENKLQAIIFEKEYSVNKYEVEKQPVADCHENVTLTFHRLLAVGSWACSTRGATM